MNTTNAIELIERYDKALRLILDVAQHEITKFHESDTYDTCEKVIDDTEKILPELKKELWAFLYPSAEMARNASDAEIVATYEHEDNDCREWPVEKLTPDEFACRINDEAFDDIKYWVRFIAV